jgi:IstB-like ATP binding protein
MTGKDHKPDSSSTIPQLSEGQLEPLFRRLNLAHTRRIYQAVADRAEKENWTYRDFLALLLAEEVAHRKQTRLQRFTRKAHFPFFKTIDEFDFSLQSTLRQSLLGSYLAGFRHGGALVDSLRQDGPRENAPGNRDRVSRHPEWLRDFLHHGRGAHRGSFQCQPERTVARSIVKLYASSRFGDR